MKSKNSKKIKNLGNFAKKGNIPWNKGKQRTEEEKKNISLGRKLAIKKYGHPRGMLGKKHSTLTKSKLSENLKSPQNRLKQKEGWIKYCESNKVLYKCPGCNKEKMITKHDFKKRKFCSYECSNKYKICKQRPNGFTSMPQCPVCDKVLSTKKSKMCRKHFQMNIYKGIENKSALNNSIRGLSFYSRWRQECYLRDNFTCQVCGLSSKHVKLELHHKKTLSQLIFDNKITSIEMALKEPLMWDKNNVVTLCTSCHKNTDSYLKKNPRYLTEKTRQRISEGQLGKHLSEEHKHKISLHFIGYSKAKKGEKRVKLIK